MRFIYPSAVLSILTLLFTGVPAIGAPQAHAATQSTAWQSGRFQIDTADVVREANIVLGSPNTSATQSMPLGNGTLGAAVWAANGFTAQLNRADNLPGRKSPGWVEIPTRAAPTYSASPTNPPPPYTTPRTTTLKPSGPTT